MKFAASAPGAGRGAVREKQRRDRAAAPVMRTRFPQLATLQLDFDFRDRTEFLPSPQVTVFHPPARAYFRFACPYSDCDGEFDLTGPVDVLAEAHQLQAAGEARCTGTRHGGLGCTLCLDYSIAARWE
jgi:hypothetical protein